MRATSASAPLTAVAKAADTGGAGATEPSNEVSEDVSEATAAALFAKVPSWWVEGVPRVYRNAHGVATHLWLDALRLDVPQLRALAAQTAPDATERPKQPVPLGALVGSEVLALLRAAARHAAKLFEQKKPPPPAPPKAPTVNEFLAWAEQERRRARLRGGSSSGSSGALPLGRSRAKTMPATPPRLGESTLVVPPPLSPARSTTASNVFDAMEEEPAHPTDPPLDLHYVIVADAIVWRAFQGLTEETGIMPAGIGPTPLEKALLVALKSYMLLDA